MIACTGDDKEFELYKDKVVPNTCTVLLVETNITKIKVNSDDFKAGISKTEFKNIPFFSYTSFRKRLKYGKESAIPSNLLKNNS